MSEMEEVMATEEQTTPSTDTTSKKEELVGETMEELPPEQIVTETIDEDGDEVEEITQITKKVVKRTMKITEVR